MDRRGIRDLKTRVGQDCSISRRRARLYRGGVHVGGVRGESYSVSAGGSSMSESCQEF